MVLALCVQGQSLSFNLASLDSNRLLMAGSAAVQSNRLQIVHGETYRAGAAWYPDKAFIEAGFETTFHVQLSSAAGFAFVIQENALPALGTSTGFGYQGIKNSLAVEFQSGRLSIHSYGPFANSASASASLATVTNGVPTLGDASIHQIKILYVPGEMRVVADNLELLSLEVDLSTLLRLDIGQAWIGFTASSSGVEILNWSFSPTSTAVNVTLASPDEGAAYICPAAIPLSATGTMSQVEFYANGVKLSGGVWSNAVPGKYSLVAVGYNGSRQRSVSAPVHISVAPSQPPIGINFAGGMGTNVFSLQPGFVAGFVAQSNWNNCLANSNGSGGLSGVMDAAGNGTPLTIDFQFAGTAEEPGVNGDDSPDYLLMKAHLAERARPSGRTNATLHINQIPYPVYDLIVYSDCDQTSSSHLAEFQIGTRSLFLQDQEWTSFSGHYAEADGIVNLGLSTSRGNFVRFRGLTNSDVTMHINERSFFDVIKSAAVNAIQIVPSILDTTILSPEVVRGPYLQSPAARSMTVCWRTDLPSDGVVRYGTNATALTTAVTNLGTVIDHVIVLTNLAPSTRYYYALGSSSTNYPAGPDWTFVTSPLPGPRPVRFWAIGDSGTSDQGPAQVRDAMLNYVQADPPDFMMMLGDNAYENGSDEEYQAAVFEMFAPTLKQTPLWSCMGNHEAYTLYIPYTNIYHFPINGEAGGVPSGTKLYYSFDYANIHFVCLETTIEDMSPEGRMLMWLQADLAANTNEWLIAYFHHPPYSKGSHDSDADYEVEMQQVRTNIIPVLEAYGLDLQLSGNSHGYERSYLIDGHYGTSDTFVPSMIKQGGSGQPEDTGAYIKAGHGPVPHSGAVYVIAGNGGVIRPDWGLNHPVMFRNMPELGSAVIDVNGSTLDFKMVRANGTIGDHFRIQKGIGSNALPQVRVIAVNSPVSESSTNPASYLVLRNSPTNDDLNVSYAISGTARNGVDYSRLDGTARIAAGATSASVPVQPLDDLEHEGNEEARITLITNTAPFRLVMMPSSSAYSGQLRGGTSAMLGAQAQWIADHTDDMSICFVLHTGDLTENNLSSEWKRTEASLTLLNGVVPYALAPGDQDGLNGPDAHTEFFNQYFFARNFGNRTAFGGLFESNRIDNCYYYFSAGGIDWMVLVLEFGPRTAALNWANRIVELNPERRVIVLTHAELHPDGTWYGASPAHQNKPTDLGRRNNGPELWEKLLRRHANIALVLSGHGAGMGQRVDVGDYGNKVIQVSANFSEDLNGGNGYLRILEFQPGEDKITMRTYSPYLKAFRDDATATSEFQQTGIFKPYHLRYTVHSGFSSAGVTILDDDPDVFPPRVTKVTSIGKSNEIVVVFSEPVSRTTAEMVGNYTLTGGAVVTRAVLQPDGKTVILFMSAALADGASFSLTVTGVQDLASPPNSVPANSSVTFQHRLALFYDDFTDGDSAGWQIIDEGTLSGPSVWSVPVGKFDQSSEIYGPGDASVGRKGTLAVCSAAGALAWSNYIAQVKIRTPGQNGVGLLFRCQDTNNYYKLELDQRQGFRKLLAVTNGVEAILASEGGGYATNTDLLLRVETADNRIFCTLNAAPLFGGIVTNDGLAKGTIALYCWKSAGVTFDDVEVAPSPPNVPPAVSITQPTNGGSFVAPVNVTLAATASDTDGIRQVEFYLGGTNLVGILTGAPPYALTLSNVQAGEYTVSAVARDMRGFYSVSAPVQFSCRLLDENFSGGNLNGWQIVDEGTVEGPSSWQVSGSKLVQNSNIYGPDSQAVTNRQGTFAIWAAPQARLWTDYIFSSRMSSSDNDGVGLLFRYQDSINYYKVELDAQRNFGRLIRKKDGVETTLALEAAGYRVNTEFELRVEVRGGAISVFMDGTALFGGPVLDSGILIGTVGLYCWGNSGATFDDVRVSALKAIDALPEIQITSPLDSAVFMYGAAISFSADAHDNDGSIGKIELFKNGGLVAQIFSAQYTVVLSNLTVGEYTLTARATDNLGARQMAQPVRFSIEYPPGFPTLREPTFRAAGQFEFKLDSQSGAIFEIEASPDMQLWNRLDTVTNQTGTLRWLDSTATNRVNRFYRAKRIP